MNIIQDLMVKADNVLDKYGEIDPNYKNITGFTSSLLEVFRNSKNPQYLLDMLKLEHPRPQSRKHWWKFSSIVSKYIRDLSGRPDYLLRFLAYLKRKSAIRNKLAQRHKKHEYRNKRERSDTRSPRGTFSSYRKDYGHRSRQKGENKYRRHKY